MRIEKKRITIKASNVLEEWAGKFDNIKRWLPKIQKKQTSALNLYYYCYWAEINPNLLLALKDDRSSTKAEEMLDTFVADKDTGLTQPGKYNVIIAVKSFFKHNYKDLAKASGAIEYTAKKQYKPTKEDLRKLYRQCYNPRDRSMLTFICCTGIAKETLSKITWGHLEKDWQTKDTPHISIGPELIKGHGRGRYKGVRQETFLTPEAKRDLIEYKEWITKRTGQPVTTKDNIYVMIRKPFEPCSYDRIGSIFIEMADRAGVPFSPHDARRYVQTALEEARIPANWARKIRGRKVRGEEAPYSKPTIEKLRQFYRDYAVVNLQFLTPEKIDERQRRIQAIIDQARMIGTAEEKIERAIKILSTRKGATPDEIIKILKRENEKENNAENPNDCANGEHCERFKQIREAELLLYLQNGWQIVHNLQNGNVIVRKG